MQEISPLFEWLWYHATDTINLDAISCYIRLAGRAKCTILQIPLCVGVPMLSSFHEVVEKFRVWASNYPLEERAGEWECDYEGWRGLSRSFIAYLDSHSPDDASEQCDKN
jgi:hypothetical protein